ncbi:MAG: hypothetical protein K6V36_16995 [Anaerolineae bacterium]|nr:hypothetical protein [Anaerolineae bacterium]
MSDFPRTMVGGVSLPRLIIGSNWFLGYSHTSRAQDKLIVEYQSRDRIAEVMSVFLRHGIDAVMGPVSQLLVDAAHDAEQRVGRKMILILTPAFNLLPRTDSKERTLWDSEPEDIFDLCAKMGATFCMPHQCVTDALVDKRAGIIRDIDRYTAMIRERGMIPGLSTHMPETVVYADRQKADVETYIQIYNAAGFLMQVEADWVMRIIHQAEKPVMTIKPLAAGRLLPAVGLAFVWSTIREQDMVTVGCLTPYEAEEVIELSLDFINGRQPQNELQRTRSKRSLDRNPA